MSNDYQITSVSESLSKKNKTGDTILFALKIHCKDAALKTDDSGIKNKHLDQRKTIEGQEINSQGCSQVIRH